MKQNYLLLALLLFFASVNAQVTIGTDTAPVKGALLQLKEWENSPPSIGANAKRGLGMPRVKLQGNSILTVAPTTGVGAVDPQTYIGMMLYNTDSIVSSKEDRLCPGLHVWTGTKWNPLLAYPPLLDARLDTTIVYNGPVIVEDLGIPDYMSPVEYRFEDIRDISWGSENAWRDGITDHQLYHWINYYHYKIKISTDTIISGRNGFSCSHNVINQYYVKSKILEYEDKGVWMTQNLATTYARGTSMDFRLELPSFIEPNSHRMVYTYPGSPKSYTSDTEPPRRWTEQLGVLYNWKAATAGEISNEEVTERLYPDPQKRIQGLCPPGWYLPSEVDWIVLSMFMKKQDELLKTSDVNLYSSRYPTNSWPSELDPNSEGGSSMKSPIILGDQTNEDGSDWLRTRITSTNGFSNSYTHFGFNALLTGYMDTQYKPKAHGTETRFWTSSADEAGKAVGIRLEHNSGKVIRLESDRKDLYSIRCKSDSDYHH